MAGYIAELRQLATHCKFGAYLDDALRNRFVCGLRSEATQKGIIDTSQCIWQVAGGFSRDIITIVD